MEKFATRPIEALVCVRAEVVPLRLEQVRRQALTAIPVEESQGSRHRRQWDPQRDGGRDDSAPARCNLPHLRSKEWGKEKVDKAGLAIESCLDVVEKSCPDDAAAAPHQRDVPVGQVPAQLLGDGLHQHVSLGVRYYFRCIQRMSQLINECCLV